MWGLKLMIPFSISLAKVMEMAHGGLPVSRGDGERITVSPPLDDLQKVEFQ